MAFCLVWWLTRRDWRAGAALLCVAAGWVTWLPFVSRTKFYYYALEFEPFVIICIVLCLGLIIGPATARTARRAVGAAIAGVYVLAVLVLFWYFYPILAGKIIPYSDWLSHMWYTRLDLTAAGRVGPGRWYYRPRTGHDHLKPRFASAPGDGQPPRCGPGPDGLSAFSQGKLSILATTRHILR